MSQPQRVIVYQSRADAEMEQWFYDHPRESLALMAVTGLVVLVWWLVSRWRRR